MRRLKLDRRTAIAAVSVAAFVGLVTTVAHRQRPRPAVPVPPPPAPAALDIEDLRAGRGMPLSTDRPPVPPMTELPLQLRVEPSPPSLPDPQALAAQVPEAKPPTAPPGPAEPLQVAGGAGASGALDGPVDEFLRVRQWVYPRVPEKLLRQRRIDASVTMQMRVGTDGRVEAVRLVHGIADCDECNQSAVEAARQFVYDAPPGAVWAAPVKMRFSYGR